MFYDFNMAATKKVFTSFVVLLVLSHTQAQNFTKEFIKNNVDFVASKNTNSHGHFLFAVCEHPDNYRILDLHCNVTIIRPSVNNKSTEIISKIELHGSDYTPEVRNLESYGSDGIALTWSDYQDKKFFDLKIAGFNYAQWRLSILNMTYPSSDVLNHFDQYFRTRTEINGTHLESIPVVYEDGQIEFYIIGEVTNIYKDDYHKPCTNLVRHQLSGPIKSTYKDDPELFQFDIKAGKVRAVCTSDRSKGVFAYGWYEGNYFKIVHSLPDGRNTLLLELGPDVDNSLPLKSQIAFNTAVVSTAHELFGACWDPVDDDFNARCSQFDVNGKVRLNLTLNQDSSLERPKAVHNFAEGGMLVLTTINEKNNKNVALRMIRADGTQSDRLEIGLHCLNFETSVAETTEELNLYITCVDKATFKYSSDSSLTLAYRSILKSKLFANNYH